MKVILLQHLSGAKSYEAGQEIEVTDLEALRFIDKGIAKAKSKKEHKSLISKVNKLEKEEEEKQTKLIAVQKETELKEEAEALLDQLSIIVSVLESIDVSYRQVFVEMFQDKFVGTETSNTSELDGTKEKEAQNTENSSESDNKNGEAE